MTIKIRILLCLMLSITMIGCGKQETTTNTDVVDLISSEIIVGTLDWKDITRLSSSNPIRVNGHAVGDLSIPKMGSRCTGFLISADVVMTNQHCIPSASYAQGVTVSFKHEAGVDEDDWQEYDCSTFIGNNKDLDFALLRCSGSPGTRFSTVTLDSTSAQENDEIYVVQQNCDYYNDKYCDWSKKYSEGDITDVGSELTHSADTLGGSSGSPVFDRDTHQVIGIHHAGYGNNGMGRGVENYAVPMSKIVPYIMSHFPSILSAAGNDDDDDDPVTSDGNGSISSADFVTIPFDGDDLEISDASDLDFYSFRNYGSKNIKIKIKFSHSAGDLDIYLYNSKGYKIANSAGTKNSESIEKQLGSGKYYVKVLGYKGATGDYSMELSRIYTKHWWFW